MTYKIYTAGKVKGTTLESCMRWRRRLESLVSKDNALGSNIVVKFIHPPMYFNYEEQNEKSASEVLLWEINQIHQSDIVVVDLEGVEKSQGTLMELGALHAINQYTSKYIPVIGVGPRSKNEWVNCVLLRREDTIEDAAKYIAKYLLV